jgi:hypothetical protein
MPDPNDQVVVGDGLRLFVVDEGATSWVLAKDADDAVAVLVDLYCVAPYGPDAAERELGWKDGRPESVTGVSRAMAAALHVVDDDQRRTILDFVEANPVRGVVASTEY